MNKKYVDGGFDLGVDTKGIDVAFGLDVDTKGIDDGFDVIFDGIESEFDSGNLDSHNTYPKVSHKSFVENNMDLFYGSLQEDARTLKNATLEMLNNETIIYKAAQARMHGDEALKYASDRLKSDKDFVKQILSINGDNIKYVDTDLLDSEEIIEQAMISTNNPYVLFMASKRIQNNPNFINKVILTATSKDINLVGLLNEDMWNNEDIVKLAVTNTPDKDLQPYAAKIADKYSNNSQIMERLVEADFTNARFASAELKQSSEIIRESNAKFEAFEGLKNGTIKLKDLDKKYFIDEEFYDKVQEEYESRIEEIARNKLEIQDGNQLKQTAKRLMFDAKQKLALSRFMGYAIKANAQQFIQDKKESLIETKNELKESLKEFISKIKNKTEEEDYSR